SSGWTYRRHFHRPMHGFHRAEGRNRRCQSPARRRRAWLLSTTIVRYRSYAGLHAKRRERQPDYASWPLCDHDEVVAEFDSGNDAMIDAISAAMKRVTWRSVGPQPDHKTV